MKVRRVRANKETDWKRDFFNPQRELEFEHIELESWSTKKRATNQNDGQSGKNFRAAFESSSTSLTICVDLFIKFPRATALLFAGRWSINANVCLLVESRFRSHQPETGRKRIRLSLASESRLLWPALACKCVGMPRRPLLTHAHKDREMGCSERKRTRRTLLKNVFHLIRG